MFASSALHKLIQSQCWDSVEDRIASHPAEVRKLADCPALHDPHRKSKALPLHHAVAMNPSKEVVDSLIGSYEKAISTTETAYHRTVLHIACMNRANASVIESVYRRYPPAVKIQDALERLPIHYAIANGTSMATMKLLLDEFPESAAVVDHRKWMPLHIACGMRAPLVIVKLVYSYYPPAVLALDEEGHSALALSKRNVIPKRAVDPKVISFLQMAQEKARKERGLLEPKEDSVPEFIEVNDDTATIGGVKSVGDKAESGSSSAKKGIFRCPR